MGTGLIPADGEVWTRRRRVIVPALHKRYVASMVGMFGDCSLHGAEGVLAAAAQKGDKVGVVSARQTTCAYSSQLKKNNHKHRHGAPQTQGVGCDGATTPAARISLIFNVVCVWPGGDGELLQPPGAGHHRQGGVQLRV
jgi:hypothetical protein